MNDTSAIVLVVATILVGICFTIRHNLKGEKDTLDTLIKENKSWIENEPLGSTTRENTITQPTTPLTFRTSPSNTAQNLYRKGD